MGRLRWVTEGGDGGWEMDMECAVTMEGTARPVPGDPLPLGVSRGPRITRSKQLDFMHRFMSSPLVPSFSGDTCNGGRGLLFSHAHLFHLASRWSLAVLEQVHVGKVVSFLKEGLSTRQEQHQQQKQELPWHRNAGKYLHDMISFGVDTELSITPDSTLLLEMYDLNKGNRGKAIYHHQFPWHKLTLEAAWPGLFVDNSGAYWDVPLSLAVDLASVAGSGSGLNYHLCLQHNSGQLKHLDGSHYAATTPMSLLQGVCAKAAVSIKKSVDIWREQQGKLKLVQPYDVFLSNPHVTASVVVGAVTAAALGDCSARINVEDESQTSNAFRFRSESNRLGLFADLFGNATLTAQRGNFQRMVLDLTRVSAQLYVSSGTAFLKGAAGLANDLLCMRKPDMDALEALCPNVLISLQQQIVGPFSFRVDSKIRINPKDRSRIVQVGESVFAIDWALKVLGSAKATAWYSPGQREAMVELRFFES